MIGINQLYHQRIVRNKISRNIQIRFSYTQKSHVLEKKSYQKMKRLHDSLTAMAFIDWIKKGHLKKLRTFLLVYANFWVFNKISKIKHFDQLISQLLMTFWSSQILICALKWRKTSFLTCFKQLHWKTCYSPF